MKFNKNIENSLLIIVILSFIFLFYLTNQKEKKELIDKNKKILLSEKSKAEVFLKKYLTSQYKNGSLFNNHLIEDYILINTKTYDVIPEEEREQLLSLLQYRITPFNKSFYKKIKELIKNKNPYNIVDFLKFYLNDRIDKFIIEKTLFYLVLIKNKLIIDLDISKDMESFNKLISHINSKKDVRFLRKKMSDILQKYGLFDKKTITLFLNSLISSQNIENLKRRVILRKQLKNIIISGEEKINYFVKGGKIFLSSKIENNLFFSIKISFINLNKLISENNFIFKFVDKKNDRYLCYKISKNLFIQSNKPINDITQNIINKDFLLLIIILFYILFIFYKIKESKKTNELMSEFVSKISHQLKTPLSSALLYLELSEKHLKNGNFKKAQEYISASNAQSKELSFLFENYSTINKLFSKNFTLNLELINLKEELNKLKKSYMYEIEYNKLSFKIDDSCNVKANIDHWIFYNIISNLISNSIKYSNSKLLQISFKLTEDKNHFKLFIMDNGIGIKKDEIKLIFKKFYKGEEGKKNERSSGLGLYISKELSIKMGGNLIFDKTYSNGSSFILLIKK